MTKDSVFKKRLLKLVKLLKTVPDKQFDFGSWVGDDWKGKKDLSCGTTACALGWATTIPSLRKKGLRLFRGKEDGKDHWDSYGYVGLRGSLLDAAKAPQEAAREIFGLTSEEFGYLFTPGGGIGIDLTDYTGKSNSLAYSPDEGASAKEIARHIKNFVKLKYPNK